MAVDGKNGVEDDDEDDLNKLLSDSKLGSEMAGMADSLDEDDLEAQMAAAMAMESGDSGDDDELARQMSAAMQEESGGRGRQGGRTDFMDALADEDQGSGQSVQPLRFQQLRPSDEHVAKGDIDRLMDVTLNVSVELGRKQMQIKEILELGPGKIIELEKLAGEPVDLLVNGKLLARGEVVVVDENFGVRITELIDPKDRIKML